MKSIIKIAISNIRKSKGQAVSFIIITAITSLLLMLGIVTTSSYQKSFSQKAEELNSPDAMFVIQDGDTYKDIFEEKMLANSETRDISSQKAIVFGSQFDYSGGTQSRVAIIMSKDDPTTKKNYLMVEETTEEYENPIYIPYLLSFDENNRIGKPFKLTGLDRSGTKNEINFTIAGYYEDIYYSTINANTTGFLVDEKQYERVLGEFDNIVDGVAFSVNLKNTENSETYTTNISSELREFIASGIIFETNHMALITSARTTTASIGSLVIICFAIIILIISLVVIKFRIGSSIEEEMQNIGAFKAIGYTSRQLILSFLCQFVLLALGGLLIGIALSYTCLPTLSYMFSIQTGVIWNPGFSLSEAIITILVVIALTALTAFVASNKIRRLHPIVALRFGVNTHSFKKNYLPISKTKGSLNVILALKQFVYSIKQNLLIGLIIFGVSFATVFGMVMFYNINIAEGVFLTHCIGAMVDFQVQAQTSDDAKKLLDEMKQNENVAEAFYYNTATVTCEGEYEIYAYVSDEFEKVKNSTSWNYEGRFPKHDNEVSLNGLIAKIMNKKIGDTVMISSSGVEKEYLITGFIQSTNYLGRDAVMTEEAVKRLNPEFKPLIISAYVKDGVDIDSFLSELEESEGKSYAYINYYKLMRSSLSSYKTIVGVLVAVIAVVTVLIVFLSLYLVIKTMLVKRKRELAIQKAIGFTTWQLTLQNVYTFLPIIVVAPTLSAIIGYFAINPILSMMFGGIGMLKVQFVYPVLMIVVAILAIVIFGSIISALISMRIKKISAYALISE